MSEDLSYWGADESDEYVTPPLELRRIGEHLFVRTASMEPGKAGRFPLRIDPALMREAAELGDGVIQLAHITKTAGSDLARDLWLGCDAVDREIITKRYFEEFSAIMGMATGESSR